jgi:hypothetical protein
MATNEQESKKVEVTVPASLHHHLLHLARHSPLGVTAAEVARTIIVERVMQLIGADFKNTIPPFERAPSPTPPPSANTPSKPG